MDFYLFQQINQFAGRWNYLDFLGIFLAKYFGYVLVFCLLIFLLVKFKKYWKMVFQALLSAILARFVIIEFIRWLWQRPRPFLGNNINLLLTSDKPAFPSGHAAFFFALSTIVFLFFEKIYPRPKFWWGVGILFFIASFLICLSRIFVGLHWPADILAGAGIGILIACLIHKISKKVKKCP